MQGAFESAAPQWVATAWDFVERHEAVTDVMLGVVYEGGDSAVAPLYLVGDDWLLDTQVGDLGIDNSAEARRELADSLRGAANELAHHAGDDPMPSFIVLFFDTETSSMDAEFIYDDLQEGVDERVPAAQWIAKWAQEQAEDVDYEDDDEDEPSDRDEDEDDEDGELFFASSNDLYSQFEYALDPPRVVIDLSAAHVWDASTVAALDAVVTKYAQHGIVAEVTGLNEASAAMHARLTGRTGA